MDKNEHKKRFDVLSVGEMRAKYYRPEESAPQIRLDPSRVPERLRDLIPLAEKWGISDDILRLDAVGKVSPAEVAELKRVIAERDDDLDEWLAGPEAHTAEPSQEYLAFTHLRMAADGC